MCRFPYLAVQLRDDLHDGHDPLGPVSRIAKRHGLRVQPIEAHGVLARFAEGAHLVATFAVDHCACDWSTSEHEAMAALTRDLLLATDVRRVRIGIWTIRGRVDRADPGRPLDVREIDTDELAALSSSSKGASSKGAWPTELALEVRRAPHPPFPTRPLRKLALGIE